MQQSLWYKDLNGVANWKDLQRALASFKCSPEMWELKLISNHFKNEYGGVDFQHLVHVLFHNEGHRGKSRNLRQEALKYSQFPRTSISVDGEVETETLAFTGTLRSSPTARASGSPKSAKSSPKAQGSPKAQAF